jgi:hypothetical protein
MAVALALAPRSVTMPQPPASGTRVATTIAGTMTLGGAVAILNIELMEQVWAYEASAQIGVALGVVWNAILGRAARYLT